jgi:tight adherence protein B
LTQLDGVLAATGHSIGPLHLIGSGAVAAGAATALTVGVMALSPALVIVAAAAAGVAAPVWLVRRAQRKFQQRFLDIFPDALDLIVRAVKAGLPVVDAMGVAAGEIPAPVGTELRVALDQMQIGVDMEVALQQSADRIRVPDFWFFVVTLALQRRTGGALAETLANLSALIRRRKEVRVRTRALTSESKASTIILGSLPVLVALALFLLSRDSMSSLFSDARGRFLLGLALILLLTGIMTMAAMVKRIMR